MAGLLDFLGGGRSQMPGQATASPLQQLLDPAVALPIAGALMGNQGNMGNFANAFGAGGQAFAQTRERNEQIAQQTKTYNWFKQNAPEFAQLIDGGAPIDQVWKLYTEQRYAKKNEDPWKVVGGQLFNTETQEFRAPPPGSPGSFETGLVPQMMRNPDTNEVIYVQPTKDGRLLPSQVPPGFVPYNPYEKAYETGLGKVHAENAGALPGKQAIAAEIDATIQDLKNDPALGSVTGPIEGRLPTWLHGPDRTRAQSKIDRVSGQAFLQARQLLKGGGAITDYESGRAEKAYARLQQAQSDADFVAALDEFNDAVQTGLAKLGGAAPAAPAAGGQRQTSRGTVWSAD